MPNFALGPLLITLFSIKLGWLPVSGRGGALNYILPAATLGAALAAILTRMVRSSMLEELSSDYVRTARAKGLSTAAVLLRHALRNALIPIITILGLQFGTLLAGTIVTETIFSWPGIGRLTVMAISSRDYPRLQGCILVIALSYVLVNLLTDVFYEFLLIRGCACHDYRRTVATVSPAKLPGSRGICDRLLVGHRGAACAMDCAFRSGLAKFPARLRAPSLHHWMGTDELGRDILSLLRDVWRAHLVVCC